jgi:hypothetical protein
MTPRPRGTTFSVSCALILAALAGCGSREDTASDDDGSNGGTAGTGGELGGPPIVAGETHPEALGRTDLSHVVFTAFSQVPTSSYDQQVLELVPDLLPRAWQRWDRWGLSPGDYAFGYATASRSLGITFVSGTTASAFFEDEVSAEDFEDQVTRNASGEPVVHPELTAIASKNGYRGSLASPGYRQRLIDIGKLQIDGGVDGLHFDEVLGGYTGANWVGGNEGFDDPHVADFGTYLCDKYKDSPATLVNERGITPEDHLDCSSTARGRSFDYRGYLARHGAQAAPLGSLNPLAADWGSNLNNRPDPAKGTFLETYPALVYWQQIVVALRKYARETHGREILISSNGIFPFVDFQTIGLYDGNHDGLGSTEVDWVPVENGELDGTVSFKEAILSLKARSKRMVEFVGGKEVPLIFFLDWPTPMMERYYALPLGARMDYIRLRLAEASALGVRFAVPLATTTDANTATALGMMDFFKELRAYYREHADLYRGAEVLPDQPTVSVPGVSAVLTRLPDGRSVLHLINHVYLGGIVPQSNVTASIPSAETPASVTLASPDFSEDRTASFEYAERTLTVTLDELDAHVAVVVE